jgi:FkbM family methyltransferase
MRRADPAPVAVRPVSPALLAAVSVLPSMEKELLLLRDLVQPGAVCVDVGASYGLYTVPLARLAGGTGTVIAFEPRPRSRAVLRVVTGALTPDNVSILPTALGSDAGRDRIVTPKRRWGPLPVPGRSFLRRDLRGDDEEGYYPGWEDEFRDAVETDVRVETLDGVFERMGLDRLDVMKIDVEGAEIEVLAGGERMIRRHRPAVLCEIEQRHTQKYGYDADDVIDWMTERGYMSLRSEGGRLVDAARITDREINYLFLPVD